MITDNKKSKRAFLLLSLIGVIGLSVSIICDLAVNKRLTWSLVVAGGIILAWSVAAGLLLAKKNKILVAMAALTVLLLPFLAVVSLFAPGDGWLAALGLPISAVSLLALWVSYFIVRHVKINRWYMAGILVFLYGVVVNGLCNYFIYQYEQVSRFAMGFNLLINISTSVAITILLIFIGNLKRNDRKKIPENEKEESIDKSSEEA